MSRLGITQKIGIALGAFAGVLLIGAIILHFTIQNLEAQFSGVINIARTMNSAAYEMEINTAEVGLRVVKYLFQPAPEQRQMIAKDIDDFNRFHVIYQDLAYNPQKKNLASEAARIFSDYASTGYRLLDQQDIFAQQSSVAIQYFRALEADMDDLLADANDRSGSSPELTKWLTNLELNQREILFRFGKALSSRNAPEFIPLEQELVHSRKQLQIHLATDDSNISHQKAVVLVDAQTQMAVHMRQIGETMLAMNNDFKHFISLRGQMDDLLDEEIQVLSEEQLRQSNHDLHRSITFADNVLLIVSFFGVVLITGVLMYISRNVVRPFQMLSVAAETLRGGDFSHRIKMNSKDELGRFAITLNDMAAQLEKAYRNLSQTNAELDAKVTARTLELASANEQLNSELNLRRQTEMELRTAVKAANEASKAKTLFLGNMSHELRTPLNAIIGFSEVIKNQMYGASSEKYADYANDINESGTHLLNLINELLDVSRIESGKLTLSEEDFDVGITLGAALHMLETQAHARRVFISSDILRDMPFLHGDSTRVLQIFINLISNAIKFTPAEGKVHVSARITLKNTLQVTITDTGIGISPNDIQKVFETFGQVENELARAHEGAGLGLPLAKILTERHDGTLEINSKPGHGTKVTVTFPAIRMVPRYFPSLRVIS